MTDSRSTVNDTTTPARQTAGRPPVLGLSTESIGDILIDDLKDNMPALKMLLHKYGEYIDENKSLEKRVASLQTELQIYEAYRDGYGKKKGDARTTATLNLIGTVLVGFGVNLSTPSMTAGGTVTLVAGVIISALAVFISLKD